MAQSAIRGIGLNLPVMPAFGADANASNVSQYANILTNRYSFAAGEVMNINAGDFMIGLGLYTTLEVLDPINGRYLPVANTPGQLHKVDCDGVNYRISNKTGCAVSASITNQGSGYTNGIYVSGVNSVTGAAGVTAVSSAGGSTWTIIVGGDINTTPTVVSGGTGYLYPAKAIITAPPAGGLACTAHTTLSAGALTLVIDDQGAGYTTAPIVTIINDPRDTVGSGASFTLALTDSGKLTGMYPNNHGTPLTAVPTLTFSGGGGSSGAATVVMNFTVTAYAVTTAGSTYTGTPVVTSAANKIAAQVAPVNPSYVSNITVPRRPSIVSALSSGGITATGQVVEDAGFGIQIAPTPIIWTNGTNPTIANAATLTLTVGGQTDQDVFIQSI